jgi:hypothetical protein
MLQHTWGEVTGRVSGSMGQVSVHASADLLAVRIRRQLQSRQARWTAFARARRYNAPRHIVMRSIEMDCVPSALDFHRRVHYEPLGPAYAEVQVAERDLHRLSRLRIRRHPDNIYC